MKGGGTDRTNGSCNGIADKISWQKATSEDTNAATNATTHKAHLADVVKAHDN